MRVSLTMRQTSSPGARFRQTLQFSIEYTDHIANLRYYYPDFVAIAADGTHWIIETKGVETVEVQRFKDNAARIWCDNATQLTDMTRWSYIKVHQRKSIGWVQKTLATSPC